MNPKTGEVLALVSTPGYDPNEFVLGMSDARWNALNEDASNPLMNRFVNTWVRDLHLRESQQRSEWMQELSIRMRI